MPRAEHSIIVGAPISLAYQRWTQFERFPEFMDNVKSVTKTGDRTSHWVVKGPLGTNIEFDADTTMLEENKRIAWNSRDGGDVITSGQVTFTELGTNQTQIHVILNYEPPAGVVGDTAAKVLSNPQAQLEEDLQRFKDLIHKEAPAKNVTGV